MKEKDLNGLPDDVLVQMYKEGNENAFAVLSNRYSILLKKVILSTVKDCQVLNDILHDALLKAMKKIKEEKYEERNFFKAWLLKLTTNLCIDYLRETKKNFIVIPILPSFFEYEEKQDFLIPDTTLNSEEYITMEEFNSEVRNLLKKLPPFQREVVYKRFFEEKLPFKEIALIQGVSINTALGRMRHALRNLRKGREYKQILN